ncbi:MULTISPECIES: signal recognition particle receptor subunit alpha [Pyrobaculum]|uniref:signal recognition particle receptor subunit alpha n=1 Tax=Pyrobaculum TaxID=2276 RepID=UPI0023F06887|nr:MULTISPECIES: signal recognition particle receptor subunit alpha [Pyrobaculum]MCX8137868.1 signal recognition particle receptor subunit alpha [Pyrobaculum aerophilum]
MASGNVRQAEKAFSKFAESVVSAVKEESLGERDVDAAISDLYYDLVENDLAVKVADAVTEELEKRLIGRCPRFGDKQVVVKRAMADAPLGILSDVPRPRLPPRLEEQAGDGTATRHDVPLPILLPQDHHPRKARLPPSGKGGTG